MNAKKCILVIEDNKDDYRILSRFLASDYKLQYCDGSGNIPLIIEENNPDCILLDYHLGSRSGREILKSIKSASNVPVIMVTNEANTDVVVECMKAGVDDYLVKDQIDRTRLLTTIGVALDNAALRKRVKILETFLPICSNCKKIRKTGCDSKKQESWQDVDIYFSEFTNTQVSHGICPNCAQELYPGLLVD